MTVKAKEQHGGREDERGGVAGEDSPDSGEVGPVKRGGEGLRWGS